MKEGELRSPIAGVVTRSAIAAGQYVKGNEPLLEIVGQDSVRIELFVPQSEIKDYPAGRKLNVTVSPYPRPITCTVLGTRNRFEASPHAIQQFYSNRDTLMPVILALAREEGCEQLLVGSVAKFSFVQRYVGW